MSCRWGYKLNLLKRMKWIWSTRLLLWKISSYLTALWVSFIRFFWCLISETEWMFYRKIDFLSWSWNGSRCGLLLGKFSLVRLSSRLMRRNKFLLRVRFIWMLFCFAKIMRFLFIILFMLVFTHSSQILPFIAPLLLLVRWNLFFPSIIQFRSLTLSSIF